MKQRRLEAKQKRRPLLFGEACTRCRKRVPFCFGEWAGSIPRGKRPVRNAHLQPLPAVPHHSPPLPIARTKGDASTGPPPRARASGSRDAFYSGPLQELDLSLGSPGVSVPTGSLKLPRENQPPPPCRRTPSSPLRTSPHLSFPGTPALARPGSRQPAGRVFLHSPRGGSGRAGLRPAEPLGAAAEAGPQRARSALRGRADAQARSRPHSCTDCPLLTPTRTRGRRAARAGPAPRRTRAREPKESLE